MRKFLVGLLALMRSIYGCGPVLAEPAATRSEAGVPTIAAPEAPIEPTAKRFLGDNPLWAIPLTLLSETRARPIFSRRGDRRPLSPPQF